MQEQQEILHNQEFEKLIEKFKTPQKLIGIQNNFFVLDGPIYIQLEGLNIPSVYRKNPNIGKEIQEFVEQNIVGKDIILVLPQTVIDTNGTPVSYKKYFSEHTDLNQIVLIGTIYFKGQSLNDKFIKSLDDATATTR